MAPPSPAMPLPAGWRAHTPNALTAARVALAVVVVTALSLPPTRVTLGVAFGVFVLASLTDALDGALARRWNAISAFGRVMDPFADKILVLSTLVLLAGPALYLDGRQVSGIQGWMVVTVLGRDLLVTSIRGAYEARGVDFSANIAGKAKMVVQSVAIPLILLVLLLSSASPGPAGTATIQAAAYLLTTATALSAFPYVLRAVRAERVART